MGRPRLRWLEDSRKEIRETKVKIWRQKAVNKADWTSVIKEGKAKALRAIGPKSKHVNKLRSHYTHFVFQRIKYARIGLYPPTQVSSNVHVRKPVIYLKTYDAV